MNNDELRTIGKNNSAREPHQSYIPGLKLGNFLYQKQKLRLQCNYTDHTDPVALNRFNNKKLNYWVPHELSELKPHYKHALSILRRDEQVLDSINTCDKKVFLMIIANDELSGKLLAVTKFRT